jgi:hypothetical protein
MNVNELKSSKFLKRTDVGDGMLVTIASVAQENVAKEGAPEELKWCMHFEEVDKPMVLNSTNGAIIAKYTGSDDSDGWIGKKIVLYDDPNVSFGGKLVGGIRVRAPRIPKVAPQAQAQAKTAPVEAVTDEALPF